MALEIAPRIRKKLAEKNPPVTEDEILECFGNRTGKYLLDIRAEHETEPPTRWFVAETDYGRKLKVVFIQAGKRVIIKSAYQPSQSVIRLYNKLTGHVD